MIDLRCIVGFFILAFIVGCTGKDVDETISGELNLLCYNVAALPQGISSSNPDLYISKISPLLNDFDIVHAQEDFCYHDSLILHNNHPYVTETLGCPPNGDGLTTFSRFPITDFERFAWEDCNWADCLTPKGFSYSKIWVEENHAIDFYNIHCNAGGTDEDFFARRSNIRQLTTHITQNSINNAIVIMGDFNSRYNRELDTIRTLLDLGFTDLWLDLIREGDIPAINSAKLDDCEPMMTTSVDCESVDKVFIKSGGGINLTGNFFQMGDDINFFYNDIDSLPLSDHEPIFARVGYEIL